MCGSKSRPDTSMCGSKSRPDRSMCGLKSRPDRSMCGSQVCPLDTPGRCVCFDNSVRGTNP